MYQTIIVEKQGSIATLFLNRPEVLNAIDFLIRDELRLAVTELERDDEVRVVIITGKGRGFCSGGDLVATMGVRYKAHGGRRRMRRSNSLYTTIAGSDKLYIAAVNGACAGAGFSLACCCDFRIAADTAEFVAPFVNIGLVPDCGILYTLPRLIGVAKTKEMVMLGEKFGAPKALEFGLVTKVAPADRLMSVTEEFARALCKKSYTALALTKSMLNRTYELSLENLLDYEANSQDICFMTDFHIETVTDVIAKMKSKKK